MCCPLTGQLTGPGVDVTHRLLALRGAQRSAQHDLQAELLLRAFRRLGHGAQDFQAARHMGNRLPVGGALKCSLPRGLPVGDGLGGQAGFAVVVGEQFRLRCDGLAEPRFEYFGDA